MVRCIYICVYTYIYIHIWCSGCSLNLISNAACCKHAVTVTREVAHCRPVSAHTFVYLQILSDTESVICSVGGFFALIRLFCHSLSFKGPVFVWNDPTTLILNEVDGPFECLNVMKKDHRRPTQHCLSVCYCCVMFGKNTCFGVYWNVLLLVCVKVWEQ